MRNRPLWGGIEAYFCAVCTRSQNGLAIDVDVGDVIKTAHVMVDKACPKKLQVITELETGSRTSSDLHQKLLGTIVMIWVLAV
eukprot:5622935-Amphidinium_carterae.1